MNKILLSAVTFAALTPGLIANVHNYFPDGKSFDREKINQQRLDTSREGSSNVTSTLVKLRTGQPTQNINAQTPEKHQEQNQANNDNADQNQYVFNSDIFDDERFDAHPSASTNKRSRGLNLVSTPARRSYSPAQQRPVQKDNFDDEVIYNYYLYRKRAVNASIPTVGANDIKLATKDIEELEEQKNAQAPKKPVHVYGYCFTPYEVNVNYAPAAATLNCSTNIGAIIFNGNFVPDNEMQTLFVSGLHIEKYNKAYRIVRSRVLNQHRNSYNVATYVNNNKIEKAWLSAGQVAMQEIRTGVDEYMKERQRSRTVEEVHNDDSGRYNDDDFDYGSLGKFPIRWDDPDRRPVKTTNYEKPEWKDYAISGGINVFTGVVHEILEAIKTDLPYAYQVVANSQFYVDLYVEPTEMAVEDSFENEPKRYPDGRGMHTYTKSKYEQQLEEQEGEGIQTTIQPGGRPTTYPATKPQVKPVPAGPNKDPWVPQRTPRPGGLQLVGPQK